ncbi:PepSY-associated TM helix domain-containing protein [Botryobacter ruber]|uniref:PepSY-associated TM helix domain-containing protein n=1 Tax=Botryobacter ruber TaxID=2171629 RepID=UPI0013E2EA23|nr:PepSY-associated TM helix domain-containing protein [Botryobacter ruber]
MKKKLHKSFSIHHWCGLIAGMFILVISLSGSILVFDDDIDEAQFARHRTLAAPAKALHIDKSFERVRQENPGWEIRITALPGAPTDALHYELRQGQLRKWIFVHPETGAELATVNQADKRFSYVLLNLHYNLLAGTAGKIVVLLTGIALLLLTITGFILYRRSIFKVLTFRQKISRKSRRATYSSLHRVVGVWALVFNLFVCVTGLSLAITIVNNAFKGGSITIATPAMPASVDAAIAQVRAAYPAFEVTYLRFPKTEDGTLQLLGRHHSDPAYYGTLYSNVQVNYTTGAIEKVDFLKDRSWPDRLLTILHPLHFGDFAGLLVKLIYCIGGLLPGILSVSGFVIWYYRQQPSQQKQRPQTVSRAA